MSKEIISGMQQDILLPPDPERIMEGLRDTGYNFNTAIADIVDNSIAADATQVDIIPVETLENGMLWNPCIVDGKHAVEINQSHPFYTKVYYPILEQNVMVTGMDALLWALAEAEFSTYNADVKEQYEDMRIAVSRCLKKLIADLPDPEVDTLE